MNDEGMFMYFSQLAINHELSEIKIFPELEKIWQKEAEKAIANEYYYYSISVLEEGLQDGSGINGPVYVYRDGDVYRVLINGDKRGDMCCGI